MVDSKEIGIRLMNLRGNKPRKVVAEHIGVSVSAMAMYENGARVPRDEIKEKIATYYNTNVQEIFFSEKCHDLRL